MHTPAHTCTHTIYTHMHTLTPHTGCDGGVGTVPEVLALPGTHLQLGGHHATAASRGQALPDHGSHLEEDHGICPAGSQGTYLA